LVRCVEVESSRLILCCLALAPCGETRAKQLLNSGHVENN
jgi:hypothetical protein